MVRAAALTCLTIAAATACGGGSSGGGGGANHVAKRAPAVAPIAHHPRGLAAELAATDARLRAAVDDWRDRARAEVPAPVTAPALRQQAILRRLAAHPRLAARTIRRLPRRDRRATRDIVAAQVALHVLNAPQRTRRARRQVRLGPAAPAAALLRFYREGRRRSGVPWNVLAAVNFVESDFGRLHNDSIAGAQGPMQFMPSTWAMYGHGDVHDPRSAILGAARFLRAAGAPRDIAAALHAYNPSDLYVTAVSRYADVLAADRRAFYELYAWAPPVGRRR